MDGVFISSQRAFCWWGGENKGPVRHARHQEVVMRISPGSAVEVAERNSPPLQVIGPGLVPINLDVHHHRAGLLNLANAPQLDVVAEASGQFIAGGIGAQVSSRESR